MKTLRFAMFALGFLVVVSAAQAQTTYLKANVPFDFVVGGQSLPAGEYSLRSLGMTSEVLAIHNDDQSDTQWALSYACEKLEPATKSVLVFRRVGDQYFLSRIWIAGNNRGREFPMSAIEKQLAMNHHDREEVIVAALITR